jgi:hypothetical protein
VTLRCYNCGKTVSTEVPDSTVVRAVVICPECLERDKHTLEKFLTNIAQAQRP